jgi:hypothetical protein
VQDFHRIRTWRFAEEIAKRLNKEGVGPNGRVWSPSTIHGHAERGTGVLINELYGGRLVWNRQRFVKDPDTVGGWRVRTRRRSG